MESEFTALIKTCVERRGVSVMTEIDPARKRGGGGEDAATGRRNKQIIGCQSGRCRDSRCLLVVRFGGGCGGMREQHTILMVIDAWILSSTTGDGHVISSCKSTQFASWIHDTN